MTRQRCLILTTAAILAATAVPFALSSRGAAPPAATPPATAPATAPATQPKALTDNVKNALKWLAAQQAPDGGWAQGEESQAMGNSGAAVKEKSNVGDTCMAVLALIRSGSTPSAGPYADNIRKGIAFVTSKVDKSEGNGLSVTDVTGTRIQMKLGPSIDTFLAGLLLGEIRNQMPDDASRKQVIASLDKVMDKIEKNQTADGKVATGGWAPSLAQGVAAKASNIAAANGAQVSESSLKGFEDFSANKQLASAATPAAGGATGGRAGIGGVGGGGTTLSVTTVAGAEFSGGTVIMGGTLVTADDAGVALYAQASNVSAMQNAQDRLDNRKKELTAQLNAPAAAPADKEKLQAELKDVSDRMQSNGQNLQHATEAITKQVNDAKFIAGFGSNGGEEFLSYLNLGETLYKKGGDDWKNWDVKMTGNLNNIQNKDGSWSGQHCITSRTFCTSAALLVLMIDRESKDISDQIKRR